MSAEDTTVEVESVATAHDVMNERAVARAQIERLREALIIADDHLDDGSYAKDAVRAVLFPDSTPAPVPGPTPADRAREIASAAVVGWPALRDLARVLADHLADHHAWHDEEPT